MTGQEPQGVVTEVIPRSLSSARVGDAATDEWMSERYGRGSAAFVRINMITTVTGATTGMDGTSETITSRTDRYVLGAIRRSADVVVVGAETVRAEGYVLPRSARLAIVTSSGDLGSGRLTSKGEDRPRALVLCPAGRADVVRRAIGQAPADVVPVDVDDDRLGPHAIVAALRERGLVRIVCEGGSALATQFIESGVVDEVCLTVSPALEPARHPFLALSESVGSTVAGMLVDDAGFSYLRLRLRG